MPSAWIDFKELRAKLKFEDVLRRYGVEIKRKGSQHHGFCPLPDHNGKKNSPSFSANLERGLFHCFGCGAKGNLLEFAALMEKVSVDDGRALRGVALKLQKEFCPDLVSLCVVEGFTSVWWLRLRGKLSLKVGSQVGN
jgi:hypothetical protein